MYDCRHESVCSLQDQPAIGANISVTVSYTVMIGSQSVQCNTSNQQCNLIVLGSQLTENRLLNISVVASNAVGSGDPVYFPTPGSLTEIMHLSNSSFSSSYVVATNIVTQDIANVTIDVLQSTVTCHLLPLYQETPNANCSITYGPSPDNCSLIFKSTTATPNSSSSLHLGRLDVEEYCYTVELHHGSTVLSITGTFRSRETVVMVRGCTFMFDPLQNVILKSLELSSPLKELALLLCPME